MDLLNVVKNISPEPVVAALILVPMLAGVLAYLFRTRMARKTIVIGTAWILTVASLLLFVMGAMSQPHPGEDIFVPKYWNTIITVADFALMTAFLCIAVMRKNILIGILALAQLLPMAWLEFGASRPEEVTPSLYMDWLTIVMVLIVSIVGSIIAVYALPYMKEHENHLALKVSKRPRFFMILLLFLGAMNGLSLSNNLLWLCFFWEVTTMCSFLMIGHDGTEIARKNAERALWMNLLGGVGFVAGILLINQANIGLSVRGILQLAADKDPRVALLILPMACFCFAGFTKAAQMPFQTWLLGAMVAPTPVSALLHSSTMVKAGVYLVVRFAPVYQHTVLTHMVAMVGAFSFVTGAMLAIGQTDAKKLLAYSTISNLGLIIACAGINTPLALAGAVMLIIFHAISKGLLFMGVGVVDHSIHSRDIEDMQGLWSRMPLTTLLMIIGILSMLMPPFGVLIAKLAALEASAQEPLAMVLLVIGSTMTVVFWTKWMGRMLTVEPTAKRHHFEHLHSMYFGPLILLTTGAVIFSLFVGPILQFLVIPAVKEYYNVSAIAGVDGVLNAPWLLVCGVFALALVVPFIWYKTRASEVTGAYMCGEEVSGAPEVSFRTVGETSSELKLRSYYFEKVVGERMHVKWITTVATLLIVILFGAVCLWK